MTRKLFTDSGEIRLRDGRVVRGIPDRLETTTLVRNRDMVHRRWCYRVRGRTVTSWAWAEGRSRSDVASAARNGLKFCASCKPLDHLPKPDVFEEGLSICPDCRYLFWSRSPSETYCAADGDSVPDNPEEGDRG